jgi:cytochrome c
VANSYPAIALGAVLTVVGVAAGLAINQGEAHRRDVQRVHALTGGDPERGRIAVGRRPCGGCHQIPGVPGAQGKVGPSLAHFAGRVYIGGRVNNTPENLAQWVKDPHQIDPQNVMPPVGVGEAEARDIAAYLYTLK